MATHVPPTIQASEPHAPAPRPLLAVLPGGYGPSDPRVPFALGRGFWHVQLYEPSARLSVRNRYTSPVLSRLTGRRDTASDGDDGDGGPVVGAGAGLA